MFSWLANRRIWLLVGVALAGQLLAGMLVMRLVIWPQADRVAQNTALLINGMSEAMAELPPDRRAKMVHDLGERGFKVRALNDPPADGPRFPSMVERRFLQSFADGLQRQDRLVWLTDRERSLWIKLDLGGEPYWVSLTSAGTKFGALGSLTLSLLASFVVAAIGGIVLQWRVDGPMRELTAKVDAYQPGETSELPDTTGPVEIKRVARAFNRLAGRIAEQDEQRGVMLAGISHDLRTPLAKVRLSLAMERGIAPETAEMVDRQLDRIEAMLNQFLDFGRCGGSEAPVRVDLAKLAGEVIALQDVPATINSTGDPVVLGQKLALQRSLSNLVGNAQRYGAPPFRIDIRGSADKVELAMQDAGPGIASDRLAEVARPFVRGDVARTGPAGTGLGLAIVEGVARAHGGTLRLENVDGGGLRATLCLPREGGVRT